MLVLVFEVSQILCRHGITGGVPEALHNQKRLSLVYTMEIHGRWCFISHPVSIMIVRTAPRCSKPERQQSKLDSGLVAGVSPESKIQK
jgi:hypothetical protein